MVCSHDMHASVTDCPYFSPAGPEAGMSCRPSMRLDSNITPMTNAPVSGEDSCLTYFFVLAAVTGRRRVTHNVIDDLQLFFVLLLTVAMAAVDLGSRREE